MKLKIKTRNDHFQMFQKRREGQSTRKSINNQDLFNDENISN